MIFNFFFNVLRFYFLLLNREEPLIELLKKTIIRIIIVRLQ